MPSLDSIQVTREEKGLPLKYGGTAKDEVLVSRIVFVPRLVKVE